MNNQKIFENRFYEVYTLGEYPKGRLLRIKNKKTCSEVLFRGKTSKTGLNV
jgi:hypothetical protein